MKYLLTIITTILGVLFFGKKFVENAEEQNKQVTDKVNEIEKQIKANAHDIDVEEHTREKLKEEMENAKKGTHTLSDNADFFKNR